MKTFTKFALTFVALTTFSTQFSFAQDVKLRIAPAAQTFVQPGQSETQTQALVIQEPDYGQPPTTYIAPPAPPQPPIRLGFDGQITCEGMRVLNVQWGSFVKQIGLESGDIITHINGRKVTSLQRYQYLLRFAVENNHGHVDLRIKNVRANWDPYAQRYVQRHLDLPHNDYDEGFYPGEAVPATIAGL